MCCFYANRNSIQLEFLKNAFNSELLFNAFLPVFSSVPWLSPALYWHDTLFKHPDFFWHVIFRLCICRNSKLTFPTTILEASFRIFCLSLFSFPPSLSWPARVVSHCSFVCYILSPSGYHVLLSHPLFSTRHRCQFSRFHVCVCVCVCVCVLVAQSCLTPCDPMDYNPPGSSVHGISQAIILEWVIISFLQGIFLAHEFLLHWQADSLPLSCQRSP